MGKIVWSMVTDWCPCHWRRDCEVAERMRVERERILEALERLTWVTPSPVLNSYASPPEVAASER